jgi:hypothetical protein
VRRYGSLEAPLGRHVLIRDILAVHPGDPLKCLCRGTGEVTLIIGNDRKTKECDKAIKAFRKLLSARVVDTPKGPRWRLGMTPEEWGFVQIFQAEMGEFAFRERLRRTVGLA